LVGSPTQLVMPLMRLFNLSGVLGRISQTTNMLKFQKSIAQ
jgi:hypothetical protein